MTRTMTEKLLVVLNATKGVVYPEIGYSYFADIKGNGRNTRSIWTVINDAGGVTYSDLNADTPAKRCAKIRAATADVPPGFSATVERV